MKKNRLYSRLIIVFIVSVGVIVYQGTKRNQRVFELLDRKGPSAETREWIMTRNYARSWMDAIHKDPADLKARLSLAVLFIQEGRNTGNYSYYDRAALQQVNEVLKRDSLNFDALTYKALLFLSQHHFADGLAVAEKARILNPYNAFIYGILIDGCVEMGNYDSAVSFSDQMVSIRPDLRSYSRISYLREIYGDYPGSIRAMEMAVEAGAPGDESTEWSRIQLGHLYENTGDWKRATMHYRIALEERPGYAYALAGLARISAAEHDFGKAISYYLQADSQITDYSLKEGLSEVYENAGKHKQADSLLEVVIQGMNRDTQAGQRDENMGHYADRELANAYILVGNYDKALEHALIEYGRRPQNIDVNETLAWVYYCRGDNASALKQISVALKTGSRNPVLLCHAGLIEARSGDKTAAKSKLKQSLATHSTITEHLKAESLDALKNL